MIRILFKVLVVGLVVSCAMEETDTSGALTVDSSSEIDVPDWLTAAYLDLNKDGTIDILDLVIHSKFFGQEVSNRNQELAMAGPCQHLVARRYHDIDVVDGDNVELKETFDAPDGGSYVYALMAFARMNPVSHPINGLPTDYNDPACLAVRLFVNEELNPENIKIKPISGPKNMFSKTIESRLDFSGSYTSDTSSSPMYPPSTLSFFNNSTCLARATCNELNRNKTRQVDMVSKFQFDFDVTGLHPITVRRFKGGLERLSKSGIPIGDDRVIRRIRITNKEPTPIHKQSPQDVTFIYYWNIGQYEGIRKSILELFNFDFWSDHAIANEYGAYVKMLPAEVRRRYFPEDIE